MFRLPNLHFELGVDCVGVDCLGVDCLVAYQFRIRINNFRKTRVLE